MDKPDWVKAEEAKMRKLIERTPQRLIDRLEVEVHNSKGQMEILSVYKVGGVLCIDVE